MCGIAGQLSQNTPVSKEVLERMSNALVKRGPDGHGIWMGDGVGFVHRRLSIIDLDERANQPMMSGSRRFVITFNGEIYNYKELRDELVARGVVLRTTSDTEALLEWFALEGEAVLDRIKGMYAFAIWDQEKRELFFARDRIGKKPFFYARLSGEFVFASELKAVLTGMSTRPAIDREAIQLFLGLQYVPSPMTGFLRVESLEPGHCGWVRTSGEVETRAYNTWKGEPSFSGTREEAVMETRRLLTQAVSRRLVADVPLGVFLSGGIDSTAIATLMAKQSSEPVWTFTMGFPSFGADEREEARITTERIGGVHHAFEANPHASADFVDELVTLYDAPYADSSCLPTYLLAKETRAHVKAVLTGDGGDELFGGYRRYRYFAQLARVNGVGVSPLAMRALSFLSRVLHDPRFTRAAETLKGLQTSFGQGYGQAFTGAYFSTKESVDYIASHYHESSGLLGALAFDLASYLPDDLNVKMDRATMANGLEARSPLLDQDLVAFACTLPREWLFDTNGGKYLLKEALRGIVPDDVFMRPKRGFQVPLHAWFQGAWRELFIERCITNGSKLFEYLPKTEIERLLKENDRGIDHGNRMWMLLVLSTWLSNHL